MDAHCSRLGLQTSQVRFMVDGARIAPDDTAEKLGLSDNAAISACNLQQQLLQQAQQAQQAHTQPSALVQCSVGAVAAHQQAQQQVQQLTQQQYADCEACLRRSHALFGTVELAELSDEQRLRLAVALQRRLNDQACPRGHAECLIAQPPLPNP